MRNIRFEGYLGPRLPREVQLKRVQRVIEEDYFQQMSIPAIAQQRGVNKSTVSRTLHRAEKRLRLCLRY